MSKYIDCDEIFVDVDIGKDGDDWKVWRCIWVEMVQLEYLNIQTLSIIDRMMLRDKPNGSENHWYYLINEIKECLSAARTGLPSLFPFDWASKAYLDMERVLIRFDAWWENEWGEYLLSLSLSSNLSCQIWE